MDLPTKPTVIIDREVRQKIQFWVNASNYEVSGLGKVLIDEKGILRVTSAILLPQKNTAGSTDIEAADIAKAMFETKDEPGDLRFWWHSHVNMNVFWSGTDHATMKLLGSTGWFLNTVFNKKEEMRTAIYMGKPYPLFVDEIPTYVQDYVAQEKLDLWKKDYEDKVKNLAHVQGNYKGKYHERQTWNAHTGKWENEEVGKSQPHLSKKERKALKRLSRWKSGAENGGLSQDDGPMTSGQELIDQKKQLYLDRISSDEIPESCVVCGWTINCECDPEDKVTAKLMEESDLCFLCERVHKACVCRFAEVRRARRAGAIVHFDPFERGEMSRVGY